MHCQYTIPTKKNAHKVTWKHPRSKEWQIIDYIIVRSNNIKDVLRCRSMRGAQCETDHNYHGKSVYKDVN